MAATHLAEVRRKLDELRALEEGLNAFVCSCDTACAGGATIDCSILEDLAQPAEGAQVVQGSACCSQCEASRPDLSLKRHPNSGSVDV